MPKEVYHAYGYVKKAAAVVNTRAYRLPATNKFTAQATLDAMVRAHGGLKAAPVTLFKIGYDQAAGRVQV